MGYVFVGPSAPTQDQLDTITAALGISEEAILWAEVAVTLALGPKAGDSLTVGSVVVLQLAGGAFSIKTGVSDTLGRIPTLTGGGSVFAPSPGVSDTVGGVVVLSMMGGTFVVGVGVSDTVGSTVSLEVEAALEYNFLSDTIGSLPANWTATLRDTGTFNVISGASCGAQYAKVVQPVYNLDHLGMSANRTLTTPDDYHRVRVSFKTGPSGSDWNVLGIHGQGGPGFVSRLVAKGDGKFYVFAGGSFVLLSPDTAWNPDTWYMAEFVLNWATQRFDVSLDGTAKGNFAFGETSIGAIDAVETSNPILVDNAGSGIIEWIRFYT
jgi:hypothetical protein